MSIHGINPGYGHPGFGPAPLRPSGAEEAQNRPVRKAEPETPTALAARSAGDALPAEVPPGTDPALWSVLTSDERAYFARARAMGPLTYGRGVRGDALPGVRLGGRIDVRV